MDEYLKTLLEQIRYKKARPYIRQELHDHLEDQIEENMHAGMSREKAEKEAVRDMGDPVETGICLDHIHQPQTAWRLLLLMILISAAGVLTHILIARQVDGQGASASGGYIIHVTAGIAVMIFLYFLDYTVLARLSKAIAVILLGVCLLAILSGGMVNGRSHYLFFCGRLILVQALMLFYVPIYGGVIYQYHGLGYSGLMKAIAWMVIPVAFILRLRAAMTAGVMLVSMLTMLTIAVRKGWFTVSKEKTIGSLWGIFMAMPTVFVLMLYWGNGLPAYQKARIQTYISNGGDAGYRTAIRSFWAVNKFAGSSGADVTETLPGFRAEYLFTYLASMYGMIAAVLICCVFAALIMAVFNTAIKQKNQLGMIMGCGCGMIFLVSFLINVLENLGALPPTATFLPFLSEGGSYIVVSYGLMGIVLSIYRYKNVYPRHVKVSIRQSKDRINYT